MLIWLVVGCGRIDFDAVARDAVASDVGGTFGIPVAITELNGPTDDDDPTLTGDLLEIVFDSERGGGVASELYVATRQDRFSSWSVPVVIAELSSPEDEDAPNLSVDGLFITFASERPGGTGGADLYASTRSDRGSPWSTPPVRIAELATGRDDEDLSVTDEGLEGVFASNRGGAVVEFNLYAVSRASDVAPWGTPRIITELNSAVDDRDTALDPSGTTLLFTSLRSGSSDIYVATRSTLSAAFEQPTPLTAINTAVEESDPWISPDGRTIVFTRGANRDLFIVEKN